ncbi:MAG TPA: peptidoglycan-binding domain-containing protein [Alphaproteobacteria bacterium]
MRNHQLSIQVLMALALAGCTTPAATPSAPAPPPASASHEEGDQLRTIQTLLAQQGYQPGPADGRNGPKTAAAIRQYEQVHNLAVDGRASPALLYSLQHKEASPPEQPPAAQDQPSEGSSFLDAVNKGIQKLGFQPLGGNTQNASSANNYAQTTGPVGQTLAQATGSGGGSGGAVGVVAQAAASSGQGAPSSDGSPCWGNPSKGGGISAECSAQQHASQEHPGASSTSAPATAAATGPGVGSNNQGSSGDPVTAYEPIDFTSLCRRADAVAARASPDFKLYEVEVSLASVTLRIDAADFHYVRTGSDGHWGDLVVHITTPTTFVNGSHSHIIAGQLLTDLGGFPDPKPKAAPSDILAPEEALRRLNRPPMSSPTIAFALPRDTAAWRLTIQLYLVGSKYHIGLPQLEPSWQWGNGGILGEDAFFDSTAPQGKWVWWAVIQRHRALEDGEYEYLYMDAVTGQATRACFMAPGREAIAKACPPES